MYGTWVPEVSFGLILMGALSEVRPFPLQRLLLKEYFFLF